MLVIIIDTFSNDERIEGEIRLITDRKDLPLKKNGWHFNWRELYRENQAAWFYGLFTEEGEVQGLLMFSLLYREMPFLNDVEVAPHNLGRKGRYANVAGCLLAYACSRSFTLGEGNYMGFLSFVSKTNLIAYYQTKYGATLAAGQRMFFSPTAGERLINKYLTLCLEEMKKEKA